MTSHYPFRLLLLAAFLLAMPLSGAAQAQSAGDIAQRPVEDIGLKKDKIPPTLAAIDDPYTLAGAGSCGAIAGQIAAISQDVGPDFDSGAKARKNAAGALGMAAVSTAIPFDGLIREVSGANAAQRRKIAAITLGIARRGFLRGLQVARHCR